MISICSLVVMIASAALTLYSFYAIFRGKVGDENDLNVIQRQLRGFALLLVANLVMIFGMILCTASILPILGGLSE